MKKIPKERICTGCGEKKSLIKFYKQSNGKYGRQSQCIKCRLKYRAKYLSSKKGQQVTKKWSHRYWRLNKEKIKINAKIWRNNNKEKVKAHGAIYRGIKKGLITTMPCKICGKKDGLIDAHHYNYNKPLDVVWLCRKHHKRIHLRNSYIQEKIQCEK